MHEVRKSDGYAEYLRPLANGLNEKGEFYDVFFFVNPEEDLELLLKGATQYVSGEFYAEIVSKRFSGIYDLYRQYTCKVRFFSGERK